MQVTWRPFVLISKKSIPVTQTVSFGGHSRRVPVDPLAEVRNGPETDWDVFERLIVRQHPSLDIDQGLIALDRAARSADPTIQRQVLGVYNLGSNGVVPPQPEKAVPLRQRLFPNAIKQSLIGNTPNPFLVWITREELTRALGLTSGSLQYIFDHFPLTVQRVNGHRHRVFIRVDEALRNLIHEYQTNYQKFTELRAKGYKLKPEVREDLRPFRTEELAGKSSGEQIQELDFHIRHLVTQGTVTGLTVRVPPGTFPENSHQYQATLIEPKSWEKHIRELRVEAAIKPALEKYLSSKEAAQRTSTDGSVIRKQCEYHRLVTLVRPSQFANRALQERTTPKGHLYWYIHPSSVDALSAQESLLSSDSFLRPLQAEREDGIPSNGVLTRKMRQQQLVGVISRSTYGSDYTEFHIFRPELERIRTNRPLFQLGIGDSWWSRDTAVLAAQYAAARALLTQNQFLSLEDACSALVESGWSLSPEQLTDLCKTGMVEALRLTGGKLDDYFIHQGTVQALGETMRFLNQFLVRLREAETIKGFNRRTIVRDTSVGLQFLGGNYVPREDIDYCHGKVQDLMTGANPLLPPRSSSRRKSR